MDWLLESKNYEQEWIQIRRDLHQIPELGNQEIKTTKYIETYLNHLGIETRKVLDTGLIGYIHGKKPGKTVAFRSDIDALPIEEETGYPFASTHKGCMHACGHDFHMTCLLAASKLLKQHEDEIHGTIVLIFQPDEELNGGAQRLLATHALDEVDAFFGCHVNPELPAGTVGIKYGPFYATASKFHVQVHGKTSHGAEPENGINAMYAAAKMIIRAEDMTSTYDGKRAVVHTGVIQSGIQENVVADYATFNGIIRTEGTELRDQMMQKFKDMLDKVNKEVGTTTDANVYYGYPGVVNHDKETAFVQSVSENLFGKENTILLDHGTMTTEDFGYYILEKPGCFYHLGVESQNGLHNSKFQPKEEALVNGAAMHASVLFQYLEENA